jgi:hypothetical protein
MSFEKASGRKASARRQLQESLRQDRGEWLIFSLVLPANGLPANAFLLRPSLFHALRQNVTPLS